MSGTHITPLMEAWGRLHFMWDNCDDGRVIPPTILIALAMLAWPKFRRSLKDPWTLAGVLAVPLLWLALVPWGGAFFDADAHPPLPVVGDGGLTALSFGWPLVSLALILRAKNARIPCTIYVLCNIPAWLWCSFIAGMAVSGDWI